MGSCYRITDNLIQLDIKAVPGASKNEFAGIQDKRLRVRIAAAPEDGKANAHLLAFLARAAGCPKRGVFLEKGEKSRLKTITLPLACAAALEKILEQQQA